MVPTDSSAVPKEAMRAAEGPSMPWARARMVMAVGSYTAAAHSPITATESSPDMTMVRPR